MPRHVIYVGMRDKGPRLPASKIDRQSGLRELEAAIEVKHAPCPLEPLANPARCTAYQTSMRLCT
jgi:hypothetical protein